MKSTIFTAGLAIVLLAGTGFAQELIQPEKSHEKWVGVWQGELDGQPGVTVTVVEDDGRLAGTAVFNIISREDQPHVIASEPHLLRATTLQGDTLHFLIKAFQDRKELQF